MSARFDDDDSALLDRWLAEERQSQAPGAAKDAARRRLAAAIPGFALAPPPLSPAPPPSVIPSAVRARFASPSRLFASTALRSAVIFGLGGAVGASLYRAARPPAIVYVDRTPAATEHAPIQTTPPEASARVSESTDHPPVAAGTGLSERPRFRRGAVASTSGVTISAERELLDRSRVALTRGEVEAALAPLEEHTQRFPRGVFREEREAMIIKVLARLGRGDEAAVAASHFRIEFPESVLSAGVQRDVGRAP